MLKLLLAASLSAILTVNQAARILAVFPAPSMSHQIVFRPLVHELVKRGHEVVIITADPAFPTEEALSNLTEIDVHNATYSKWNDEFVSEFKGDLDFTEQWEIIFEVTVGLIDRLFDVEDVKRFISDKRQKFDLLLLEAFFRPGLIFSEIYNIPVILVSSYGACFNNYAMMGAAEHPLLYTSIQRQRNLNLSIWEKFAEIYKYYKMYSLLNGKYAALENNRLRKYFGNNIPSVEEMSKSVDMLFVNMHPMFEGIRSVPPGVVYLGGLHLTPGKDLPHDLKSFLDNSKHGVIYFSLGTNIDPTLLPKEKIELIVKVFSELPYNVLMKWNGDKLPGKPCNVKIAKWLPQSDLLRHHNVKAFITQAGLQSTDEAISAGVPLIGIPMALDQFHNAEKYLYYKIGLKLDLESLTEEQFLNTIKTVAEDNSYRRNIVKLRELMNDQPQRPLERAVWWTEHVLRHGGAKHLRSPATNISWTEYLQLELILVTLAFLLFVIYLFVIVYYRINSLIVKVKKSE